MSESFIRCQLNLKRMLRERGWTAYDLAKTSGVHHASIYKIAKGHMVPSVDILDRLAKGFGVEPGDLLL